MMDHMMTFQMSQIRSREHRTAMNVFDCCPERTYSSRTIAAHPTAAPETARACAPAAIRAEGVTKGYRLGKNNDVAALRGATIEIASGEMVAIVGPSGSGKSTLMHILGCLDTPDSGTVHIGGTRVDDLKGRELTQVRSRTVGFIFQGFNLIPTLSAVDNVALAAEYAGTPRAQAVARARELLDLVGLGDRQGHLPSELSGGQQQRVAIARALVNRPALVLGDEPTGDLDTATSEEIVALMRRLNAETGTTFVIVTHNLEVAEACDRTIRMRDGAVESHGYDEVGELADDIFADEPATASRFAPRPLAAPRTAPACC